jgi:hypothetical protein
MPKTSRKFVEKSKMNGYDKAASYNEQFRRNQIRRGRKCIYYQNCMLARAGPRGVRGLVQVKIRGASAPCAQLDDFFLLAFTSSSSSPLPVFTAYRPHVVGPRGLHCQPHLRGRGKTNRGAWCLGTVRTALGPALMLAVAYATTVAVFMINSYITILRCIVANKSTASRQRQCHDECMPKQTQ